MARKEDIELIKSRALHMLEAARFHLKRRHYDLAAFMAEQAVQLFTKYKILELTGEMPRTHTIRHLFGILRELVGSKASIIDDYVEKKRSLFIRLEEAYIASRYLFRRYEKEETRELIEFSEEVIHFVSNIQV